MKTTANGLYKYDCDDIIQNIHKLNCENNNWQYSYFKTGRAFASSGRIYKYASYFGTEPNKPHQ